MKLSELGECDTGQVEIFQHALDSNRGLLDKLTSLADNATSPDEMLAWDRQIIRIIRRDLKLIQAIHYLEKPKKDLRELARSAHYFVQWEFDERGIPEHSIFVPLAFENFCAHPDSSLERFRDNTIEAPTTNPLFVPPVLINFRANLPDSTMLSPFLTDQQWLLIRDSFTSLREDVEFFRKYKRRKPRFSPRLLFEAVLLKLACNLSWDALPHIIYTFHPDFASFPLRECQRLYRDLFKTGRLQAIYKQFGWHLEVNGETTLEDLAMQGYFQLGKNGVALASGQSLTWQLFTALLLLQRAYHNQRASQREKNAERRRAGRYYRFPSPRPHRAKRSSDSSASIEQLFFSRPRIPEPGTFEPLEKSTAHKKFQKIAHFDREVAKCLRHPDLLKQPPPKIQGEPDE